jgi:hypothetical protein
MLAFATGSSGVQNKKIYITANDCNAILFDFFIFLFEPFIRVIHAACDFGNFPGRSQISGERNKKNDKILYAIGCKNHFH